MGVVMITSGMCSLIRAQTMEEISLGLILLLCGSFFDDRISITRSSVFCATICVDYIVKYQSEINKSCPRLVAAPSEAEITAGTIRINTVHVHSGKAIFTFLR